MLLFRGPVLSELNKMNEMMNELKVNRQGINKNNIKYMRNVYL